LKSYTYTYPKYWTTYLVFSSLSNDCLNMEKYSWKYRYIYIYICIYDFNKTYPKSIQRNNSKSTLTTRCIKTSYERYSDTDAESNGTVANMKMFNSARINWFWHSILFLDKKNHQLVKIIFFILFINIFHKL
jgi:hypothetical protein